VGVLLICFVSIDRAFLGKIFNCRFESSNRFERIMHSFADCHKGSFRFTRLPSTGPAAVPQPGRRARGADALAHAGGDRAESARGASKRFDRDGELEGANVAALGAAFRHQPRRVASSRTATSIRGEERPQGRDLAEAMTNP
jgi:hypothetical protein